MAYKVEKQPDSLFDFEYENKTYFLHNLENLSAKTLQGFSKYENELEVLKALCFDESAFNVVENMKSGEMRGLFEAWAKDNNLTSQDFLESSKPTKNIKKK